ncbi:MAG: methionyl-tRNA formyltransferase [Saprospiraceae bacterium]|nr:methionyl-tRNA formyltransferase [Saprospiraceae bacterium]
MGTPQFAVSSLDILIKNGYNVVGVITAPDKPAGRGKKITESDVKKYALENGLNILQPTNLKDESFIHELMELRADLQIVVAFRMLPEIVWNMPPMGTFNLHASLLPQYRGAAPINWAIINGEKETGLTTFFLKHEIDTGSIISSEKVIIENEDTVGDLHDKLMRFGANLVLKSVKLIQENSFKPTPQSEIIENHMIIKTAPKIFKEDCRINWDESIENLYNFIRGLSPYPAAFSEFISPDDNIFSFKIFKASIIPDSNIRFENKILTDGKSYLYIKVNGGLLYINEIQIAGKKRMPIEDFLRGFPINTTWKLK